MFAFDSSHDLHIKAEVTNYDYTDRTAPQFVSASTHSGNHYTLTLTFADERIYWVSIELENSWTTIASYVVDTHGCGR